jgi:WD40 repeat protein
LRLWDTRTGRQLFSTETAARSLQFSPDDRLLAVEIDLDRKKLRLWQVALPFGYRTLVNESITEKEAYGSCAIDAKNGLLAVAMKSGVGLWDLATGVQLTVLEIGRSSCLWEPSGALLTGGPKELLSWPIERDSAAPHTLRIGPPRKLPLPFSLTNVVMSQDGRVLASAGSRLTGLRSKVWHRELAKPPLDLPYHYDPRHIDVSPDGRWVATGSHWASKVKISSAQTGELVQELPVEDSSRVRFSQRWLATTGGGCRLWAVDSWKPGPYIGGVQVAFSRDGNVLAVETGHGVIRLVNPDTGREYARLEDPNQDRAGEMCFSPDGAQLASTNGDSNSIHIWDLRMIREYLSRLDLDW